MKRDGQEPELDVSRETLERLEVYAGLIEKWNPRINLVSRSSLKDLWTRHIVDSVQVARCVNPKGHWVDLGSGGGLPGIVVAIIATDEWPDVNVTLVESDQRKSAFLRTAARETGVSCKVLAKRIEEIEPLEADILSARALADLDTLLCYCERHLKPEGTALFPKGVTWKKEVQAAEQHWRFDLETRTSVTENKAAILKIQGVTRV